jgi:DNA polymerase-1
LDQTGGIDVYYHLLRQKLEETFQALLSLCLGLQYGLRSLIKPEKGKVLAYIDYSQQEFLIAAALSDDQEMKATYSTGDPYLAFAKQAGIVPLEATKSTHKAARDLSKACVLGGSIRYGAR